LEPPVPQNPSPPVDLDAYFARIGYGGPRTPTLETLSALHELHPAAIPFEAIDVQLGRTIDLAPAAVDAKLIGARRGGYCFEQNGLLQRVLETLGFQVEPLLARVVWMALPGDAPRPRTHMALRVTIDGQAFLADVGFGGFVLTTPLRFDDTAAQTTGHEPFRLTPAGHELRLEAMFGATWTPLYDLSLEPQLVADFEAANWYTSTYPTSHFRHGLRVGRTTPEARHNLLNDRLTIRRPDGSMDRRNLTIAELEQTLAETFILPVEAEWRALLERAVEAGAD
jgi:N-hydroxyarylamine O-acetyltransferase